MLAQVLQLHFQFREDTDVPRLGPTISSFQSGIGDETDRLGIREQRLVFSQALLEQGDILGVQMDSDRLFRLQALDHFTHQGFHWEIPGLDRLMEQSAGHCNGQLHGGLLQFA